MNVTYTCKNCHQIFTQVEGRAWTSDSSLASNYCRSTCHDIYTPVELTAVPNLDKATLLLKRFLKKIFKTNEEKLEERLAADANTMDASRRKVTMFSAGTICMPGQSLWTVTASSGLSPDAKDLLKLTVDVASHINSGGGTGSSSSCIPMNVLILLLKEATIGQRKTLGVQELLNSPTARATATAPARATESIYNLSTPPPPLQFSPSPLSEQVAAKLVVPPDVLSVPLGQVRNGNDCWAISLAVVLMSLPHFLGLLRELVKSCEEPQAPVTLAFVQNFLNHGNVSGKDFSASVRSLVRALGNSSIVEGEQQDALEMLILSFQRINEETFSVVGVDESSDRVNRFGLALRELGHFFFDTLTTKAFETCPGCYEPPRVNRTKEQSLLFFTIPSITKITTSTAADPLQFTTGIGDGSSNFTHALNSVQRAASEGDCKCGAMRLHTTVERLINFPSIFLIKNQSVAPLSPDECLFIDGRRYKCVGVIQRTGLVGGSGHYYAVTLREGVWYVVDDDVVERLDSFSGIYLLDGLSVVCIYQWFDDVPILASMNEVVQVTEEAVVVPELAAPPPLPLPHPLEFSAAAAKQAINSAQTLLRRYRGMPSEADVPDLRHLGGFTFRDAEALGNLSQWLRDNHLTALGVRLNEDSARNPGRSTYIYNSQLFTMLSTVIYRFVTGRKKGGVDGFDPFSYAALAMPVAVVCGNPLGRGSTTNHWAILYFDLKSCTIYYLDTLTFRKNEAGKFIRVIPDCVALRVVRVGLRWLQDLHQHFRESPLPGDWKCVSTPSWYAHQTNGSSCGAFVCAALMFMSTGVIPTALQLPASIESSLEWRARILLTIVGKPPINVEICGRGGSRKSVLHDGGGGIGAAPRVRSVAAVGKLMRRGGTSGSASGTKRARASDKEKVSNADDADEVDEAVAAGVKDGEGGGGDDDSEAGFVRSWKKTKRRKRLTIDEVNVARAQDIVKTNAAIDAVALARAAGDPVAFRNVTVDKLRIYLRMCRRPNTMFDAGITVGNKPVLIERVLKLTGDVTVQRYAGDTNDSSSSSTSDGEGSKKAASDDDL